MSLVTTYRDKRVVSSACPLLAQTRRKIIPLRHGQDQSGEIQKHLFAKKSLNWGLKFEKVRESLIIMILVFFVNQFLSENQPIFWSNFWSNLWTSLLCHIVILSR
jgi:hypothetical protein